MPRTAQGVHQGQRELVVVADERLGQVGGDRRRELARGAPGLAGAGVDVRHGADAALSQGPRDGLRPDRVRGPDAALDIGDPPIAAVDEVVDRRPRAAGVVGLDHPGDRAVRRAGTGSDGPAGRTRAGRGRPARGHPSARSRTTRSPRRRSGARRRCAARGARARDPSRRPRSSPRSRAGAPPARTPRRPGRGPGRAGRAGAAPACASGGRAGSGPPRSGRSAARLRRP